MVQVFHGSDRLKCEMENRWPGSSISAFRAVSHKAESFERFRRFAADSELNSIRRRIHRLPSSSVPNLLEACGRHTKPDPQRWDDREASRGDWSHFHCGAQKILGASQGDVDREEKQRPSCTALRCHGEREPNKNPWQEEAMATVTPSWFASVPAVPASGSGPFAYYNPTMMPGWHAPPGGAPGSAPPSYSHGTQPPTTATPLRPGGLPHPPSLGAGFGVTATPPCSPRLQRANTWATSMAPGAFPSQPQRQVPPARQYGGWQLPPEPLTGGHVFGAGTQRATKRRITEVEGPVDTGERAAKRLATELEKFRLDQASAVPVTR